MSKKTGVIIARMQPIHNGHIELIKHAAKENDEVLIFVGSADKLDYRNPIPIKLRIEMIVEALKENNLDEKTKVVPLDDLTDESDNSHDWGWYIVEKTTNEIGNIPFTIYYSDGFQIITQWFPPFILYDRVSLKLLARGTTAEGISATKVRDLILSNDVHELEKYVPKSVLKRKERLHGNIEAHQK